jgi:hypothetical protein
VSVGNQGRGNDLGCQRKPAALTMHVLLIGIGVQVIWYLALALVLLRM